MAVYGYSIIGAGPGSAVLLPPEGADIAGFLVWLYHVAPMAEEDIRVQDVQSSCGLLFRRKAGSFSHGIDAAWLSLVPRHILAAKSGGTTRIFITVDAGPSVPLMHGMHVHMDKNKLHWAEGDAGNLDKMAGMPFPLMEWDSPAMNDKDSESA